MGSVDGERDSMRRLVQLRNTLAEVLARRTDRRGSHAFIALGVVVAMLAATLAAALGTAQHASLLNLLDGHGWLSNSSNGAILLANGSTSKVDLELLVKGAKGHRLEVLQAGENAVLWDRTAGTVGSLNLSAFKIEDNRRVAGNARSRNVDVEDASNAVFIIHRKEGTIEALDPVSTRVLGRTDIHGTLTAGVVSSTGRLWVVDAATGSLVSATVSSGHLRTGKGGRVVPRKTAAAQLAISLVDNSPAVLDLHNGTFITAPGGARGSLAHIPSLSRQSAQSVLIPKIVTGSTVPVAESGSGQVVLVHLSGNATVSSVSSPIQPPGIGPQDLLGTPQVYNGRVYVPDLTRHKLVVLDDQGNVASAPIGLPWKHGPIHISLQGGYLWVNQPDGNNAIVVNPTGAVHEINKGNPAAISNVVPPRITLPPPPPPPPAPTPANPTNPAPTRVAPAPTSTVIVPPKAPTAPTSVTAFAGNRAVTLSWSGSANGGSPITGYPVVWKVVSGNGSSGTKVVRSSPFTVKGLTNGTKYAFTVAASNSVGTSAASTAVNATPSSAVPSAPTQVTASSNNDGTISVSWNPANGQGHRITAYEVLITDTGAATSGTGATGAANVKVSGSSTQVKVSSQNGSIQLGQTYTFSVVSDNNLNKTSLPSNASNPVTAQEPPGAVTGLTATPNGSGQLSVGWTCNPSDPTCSGGSDVTSFKVSISPATIATTTIAAATGQSSYSASLSGLTNGTAYTVSVAACNVLGCTPASQVPSAAPATPFGAPGTPVVAASANGNSITWTWTTPSDPGSSITSYNVSVDGGGASSVVGNSYTQTFSCSQSHSLSVVAVNAGGNSSAPGSASATTAACPPAPSVTISVGNSTTDSNGSTMPGCSGCHWVNVVVSHFPANSSITFTCYDPSQFWVNPGSGGFSAWYSTNASGSASWAPPTGHPEDGCAAIGVKVYLVVSAGGKSATSNTVQF